MIDTSEFVKQLKEAIEYDPISKKHWTGYKVVTNQDMKIMCSHYFGKEYDLLTNSEKTKIRIKVFKELEVQNGKTTKTRN